MKRKNIFTLFIIYTIGIISILSIYSFRNADDKPEKSNSDNLNPNQNSVISSFKMDQNNISTWYRNNGSFNRNPNTDNSGFEWPKGTTKFARYVSGLWMGAQVGVDTLVAVAYYSYEFKSGYIDNNGIPQGFTDPLYRVYSIIRGDTISPDYLGWPANQGAYLNGKGRPYFLGNQTMFYSYTDGYPDSHTSSPGSTAPMKAVILQTNWSYTIEDFRDVIFTEYKIINRNTLPWNNAYIAIWTDDDLGTSSDDAVGIDTTIMMSYTYNFTNNDGIYGSPPPAVGFVVLRNPIIPSPGDTVKYYNPPGSNNLVVKPNFKESMISSHNVFANGSSTVGDPRNYKETYNIFQGLQRTGTSWINPNTNHTTKYAFSNGWNVTSGEDWRSIMSFGPLTMNPGDTQSIIVAQVIAKGTSNINSITRIRNLSVFLQEVYNNNFQNLVGVNNISSEIPNGFSLSQNYPNPFNPITHLEFRISKPGFVSLKVYDVLGNEVKTLVNENKPAGNYKVEFDGSGLSSGIYFYQLVVSSSNQLTAEGFSDTKRMILVK